ncbi:S26 family signal peptidase, partial [Mesorhizobium sp. M1393]
MSRRPTIRLIGSHLRRIRARKTIAVATIGLGLIGFAAFGKPSPWLVWNASASAPVGLYRVASGSPARGDLVLVRPPKPVAAEAPPPLKNPPHQPRGERRAPRRGDPEGPRR